MTDHTNPMRPPDALPWSVMDAYLRDTCTPDEAQAVQAWLEAHPEGGEELESLAGVVRGASKPFEMVDAASGWRRIEAAIAGQPAVAPNGRRRSRRDRRQVWGGAGRLWIAGLLLVIAIGAGTVWFGAT